MREGCTAGRSCLHRPMRGHKASTRARHLHSPGPFCQRVLLTLEEKKVHYAKRFVDIQNKPDWSVGGLSCGDRRRLVTATATQWVAIADTCPLQAAGGQPRRICAAPEGRRDRGMDCRFWQDRGLRGGRVSRARHRPRGGQQECVSGLSLWMWLLAVSIPACVAGDALTPCVFWRLCQSRVGPHPTPLAFQGRGSLPCLCQLHQEL